MHGFARIRSPASRGSCRSVDSIGNPIYELYGYSATGNAVAALRVGGSTFTARGGIVATGSWHHVAATWDGNDLVA